MIGWRWLYALWGAPSRVPEWDGLPDRWRDPHVHLLRLLQVHAAFRFFAFALGAGLLFTPTIGSIEPTLTVALAVLVGVVAALRVLAPPVRFARHTTLEGTALTSELILILALAFTSNGVNSPFLIHSLSPVLSGALFLNARISSALGIGAAATVTGTHVLTPLVADEVLVPLGDAVTGIVLYLGAIALVVALPFLANVNLAIHRHAISRQEERDRLRREVHDDVAQTLAFLSLKVQRLEELTAAGRPVIRVRDLWEISQGVRRAYLAVRDYLEEATVGVENRPLRLRLSGLVDAWQEGTGLSADLQVRGEEPELSEVARRHIAQIAKEAMVNARKHAQPSRVTLALEWSDSVMTLRARDDGRGMPARTPWGLGLTGMRERAALIGAELDVESTLEEGTEVVVRLPLSREEAR